MLEEKEREFGLLSLPILPASSTSSCSMLDDLIQLVNNLNDYEETLVNDILPKDRKKRHEYLQHLKDVGLPVSCTLYSQCQTGSIESLHFIWKIAGKKDEKTQAETCLRIQQKLPKYHSKLVRSTFVAAAQRLNIKPMYARYLYGIATDDASAPQNAHTSAVDQRLLDYVRFEDDSIVMDLRDIHREGESHFSIFFDAAKQFIEETVGAAVDERRHDPVAHMAVAMSAADLYR